MDPEFTFERKALAKYIAHTSKEEQIVTIPDQVIQNQKAFDNKPFPAIFRTDGGDKEQIVWLDGSAYDLRSNRRLVPIVKDWRQRVNYEVRARLVDDLLAAGYEISLSDRGVEDYVSRKGGREKLLSMLDDVDEIDMYVYQVGKREHIAWIYIINWNSGAEVIGDCTENMSKITNRVCKWAEKKFGSNPRLRLPS
ncbi:hypothetical protein JQ617_38790 [Bradyrhizobium sp. KB893862 SZCCT0404]|uniref:hypothetical protein n=1 Tax=Bradyrhizobium sp. KB893862 SZCCT0404 TaxID=2807672 RepID=UPI001BA43EEF|nr:hypothetical protein [Bradyrhizobium sp. KB893862 SZCCT0404]MBR1179968.1 hypothetical protein [Bradyrhizobium sp. KB893862 SZCCT0404]